MGIYGPITTPAASGGAGVATATITTPQVVRGLIAGIFIQYNGSPPATADVGIRTAGKAGVLPSHNVLTILNANTDGYFPPRVQSVDTSGVVTGSYEPFYVEDQLKLDLAQVDDGDSVTIWIYVL